MAIVKDEFTPPKTQAASGSTVVDISALNLAQNDVLIVWAETSTGTFTNATGNNDGSYGAANYSHAGNNELHCWVHSVGATPDTQITFTVSTTNPHQAFHFQVIDDADIADIIEASGTAGSNTISPTMATVTTLTNDCLLVGASIGGNFSFVLPPEQYHISGMRSDGVGSAGNVGLCGFWSYLETAGTTTADAMIVAHTSAKSYSCILLAINNTSGGRVPGYVDPSTPPVQYLHIMGHDTGSGHLSDNTEYNPTSSGAAELITSLTSSSFTNTSDVYSEPFEELDFIADGYSSPAWYNTSGANNDAILMFGIGITETYPGPDNYDLSSSLIICPTRTNSSNFHGESRIGFAIGFSDRTNARFFQLPCVDSAPSAADGKFPTVIDLSITDYVMDTIGTPNMANVGALIYVQEPRTTNQKLYLAPVSIMRPAMIAGGTSTNPVGMEVVRDYVKWFHYTVQNQGGLSTVQWYVGHNTQDGTGGGSGNASHTTFRNQSFVYPGAGQINFKVNAATFEHRIYKANTSDSADYRDSSWDMGDFGKWIIDASTANADIYQFDGCVVANATPTLQNLSNIDISGLSFRGSKQLTHNGKSLSGVTVSNVANGETAALQFSAANQTELTAIGTQCGTLTVSNNTSAPAIRINYTGTAGAVTIDLSNATFSGNTIDLHFESTNNCDLSITRNSGTLNTTNSVGSTVTVVAPTNALRINPDVTITGAIRYFDSSPDDQTPNDSGTGDFLDYEYSTTDPIDIEVVEQGYVPVNQQNVTPINGTLTIEMDLDEAYNASHSLTIVTHYTYNRATKAFAILADQNAFDVRSSMADTIRLNSSYFNTPLLLEAKPGGKRIDLIDGATITSMATWKGAGMERYDAADAINPVEKWYAIQSVNNIAGSAVVYRQTNSGDFTVGSLTNNVFDETLQFYSDPDHDGTPATENNSYLLIKALQVGYRQARNDVVAGNGGASLKADLYTIGLAPTAHDYAGNPATDLSLTMTLVAGPFTVGSKTFAYKWVDAGTNSGTDIADWINYMGATSPNGLIPGSTGLRWAEMPDMVIYVTGGVETAQGYREGATPTLVGFYMERGGADHPDMVRAQADDGTYYKPAQSATATISNFATTSRLQIYDTLNAVELYNGVPGATSYQFSETYSVDRDIRVRITNKVTTTASIMIEATVGSITASNPDVAYIANQSADTTYNNNAVDGDTVTGITINDTTDRVEIGIAGGSVPWKDIYAYQVAWLHTEAGIRDDFAFIDAPDTANYILTGFKIKNTSSPSVPLVITGGYGRDATTGASIDLIDTTGGSLFFAPDHVIPYATGSGVTSADKTEIIAGVTSSVSDTLPDAVWQSPKAIPKLLSVE